MQLAFSYGMAVRIQDELSQAQKIDNKSQDVFC